MPVGMWIWHMLQNLAIISLISSLSLPKSVKKEI